MSETSDKPQHPARATYDANREASQQAFLAAYPAAGNISQTAKAVGIHPETVYRLWRKDPEFEVQFQMAQELHADYLEELAVKKVKTEDPRNNLLHITLLNANRPEKYRPNQPVQETGAKEALESMTRAVVQFNQTNIVINNGEKLQQATSSDNGFKQPPTLTIDGISHPVEEEE